MKWILIGAVVAVVIVAFVRLFIFGLCKAAARGDRMTEEAERREKEKEK